MIPFVVIVARPSPELDLGLDAADDLSDRLLVFSHPSEASKVLLSPSGSAPARIGLVLVEIGSATADVEDFLARLRRERATALVPVVLWGPAEACARFDPEGDTRAHGCVHKHSDARADARALAQTLHYWAYVNHPPQSASTLQGVGGPA